MSTYNYMFYLPESPAVECTEGTDPPREHKERSTPQNDCSSGIGRTACTIALGTIPLVFLNRFCGIDGNYVQYPFFASAAGTALIYLARYLANEQEMTRIRTAPRLQDVDLRKLDSRQLEQAKIRLNQEVERRVEEFNYLKQSLRDS